MFPNIDFNPRTPYGMRRVESMNDDLPDEISIHAPLTGCDPMDCWSFPPSIKISIHAPLTGCDLTNSFSNNTESIFQSTHPLRDATSMTLPAPVMIFYFNPRTPYGMRHWIIVIINSVHLFQSTHPLRDATSWRIRTWLIIQNFNPRTPYGMRLFPFECLQ